LNLSVLLNYNSGHPYYLVVPDSRPSIGPFSGTTPNVFQVDMKLEKGFSIINGLNLNLYFYVINLFDTKNVYDVFESTGSAEDDGRDLTDFVLIFGEQYETLYQLLNQYNPKYEQQTFYGPPSQIGLGIKLNY
jgi:hypothetical protein